MNIIEKAAVWYLEKKGWIVLPNSWIGMLIGGGSAHSIEHFEVGKPSAWTVTLPAASRDLQAFLYAINHAVIDGRGIPNMFSITGGSYIADYTSERVL